MPTPIAALAVSSGFLQPGDQQEKDQLVLNADLALSQMSEILQSIQTSQVWSDQIAAEFPDLFSQLL